MVKRFLTSKEAAEYLGIDVADFEKMAGKSKIPSYKIGGMYTRFKVDDLDAYRRRTPNRCRNRHPNPLGSRIKDFFYFNDFYLYSGIAIIVILYFIFK